MNIPLMPKATAIWLVDNTSLTFSQIADFCGLHILEVESIANGDLDNQMVGFDPIISSQLTQEEISRCEADKNARLQLKPSPYIEDTKVLRKYTPKAKRHDKPDAIAWMLKYYPEIHENDVCNLLGTTRATLNSIRNKTHRSSATLKPRSPVVLGLCSEAELDFVIAKQKRS